MLLSQLEAGENPGDQLQDSRYFAFKVRVKNSDAQKGKSGGYRVIYYIRNADRTVLVTLYSKSDQDDIQSNDVQRIINKYEQLSEID